MTASSFPPDKMVPGREKKGYCHRNCCHRNWLGMAHKRHGAITIGNFILVNPRRWASITSPTRSPVYFEEVLHSIQWQVSGMVRFGLTYARDAGLAALFGEGAHNSPIEAKAMGMSQNLFREYKKFRDQQCQ